MTNNKLPPHLQYQQEAHDLIMRSMGLPTTKDIAENEAIKRQESEMDDGHDCRLSPEDGCTHPSHPQI